MTDPASPNPTNADRPVPKPRRRYRRRDLPLLSDPYRTLNAKHTRCKKCQSANLKATRRERAYEEGDTVVQRVECECGEVWVVVYE